MKRSSERERESRDKRYNGGVDEVGMGGVDEVGMDRGPVGSGRQRRNLIPYRCLAHVTATSVRNVTENILGPITPNYWEKERQMDFTPAFLFPFLNN